MLTASSLVRDPAFEEKRVHVTVEQYRAYHARGYVVVRGLLAPSEIEELRLHTEDILEGRLPEQKTAMRPRSIEEDRGDMMQELEAPPPGLTGLERAMHFVRMHMLHRQLPLHERTLLHPRVLDVLEGLIGPDVLALQSMLFFKPPGKEGQGWHQDSYYIPTYPDTLCGAWIAIDDADEENGAMWMAAGSHVEPVHPGAAGFVSFGDRRLAGIASVSNASDPDDAKNELAAIAERYPVELVAAKPGDVVFFHGHVLHRSKKNVSRDRFRRCFVGHYCNARSMTPWGAHGPGDMNPENFSTNHIHILGRGDTHLSFARPRFETPCAALSSVEERRRTTVDAIAMMSGVDVWNDPLYRAGS